jgi:N utilization substance protein B
VDFDYLIKVLKDIPKNQEEVEKHVDAYTDTFKYADMDVIDQALFLLGYMERKQLQTPKEVLLNELIELAKRYCDEGSPKLINGIMHKIVHEVEEK